MTFEKKNKPNVVKTFRDFTREAREHGAVFDLWQKAHGTEETFFPPALTIHFNESMSASTTAFGVTKEVKGPGGVGAVENVLCDDVLEFRKQACAASIKSFSDVARYYRGYLLACTALVETFLNRVVHVARDFANVHPGIAQLLKPGPFDERIELWVSIFCLAKPISQLKATNAWCHYNELRVERNALLHGVDQLYGFSVPELADKFNKVRDGVGGFILKLREMQGMSELPFAQRLQTAPRVKYTPEPVTKKT